MAGEGLVVWLVRVLWVMEIDKQMVGTIIHLLFMSHLTHKLGRGRLPSVVRCATSPWCIGGNHLTGDAHCSHLCPYSSPAMLHEIPGLYVGSKLGRLG